MYRGRGDYRGGYQRGDPGLFGGLGAIVKKAFSGALHMGPLAPIGMALDARAALSRKGVNLPVAGGPPGASEVGRGVERYLSPEVGITKPIGGTHAGTPHGPLMGPPVGPPMLGAGGGRVMRPSGKGYYTQRHLAALAKGLTRARPRLNPFNPHALRRASRRAHAFLRMARKLTRYYVAKHPKGKAYIKGRSKK